MHSGRPENPKKYYKSKKTGVIYQVANYGFDVDTGIKRVILKDTSNGERWDMPESRLYDTDRWERLPDRPPVKRELQYPGFTNDPRKEFIDNGYTESDTRSTGADRTFSSFSRRYSSFDR